MVQKTLKSVDFSQGDSLEDVVTLAAVLIQLRTVF